VSAAQTHHDREFPETLGERIAVACGLAWLFSGVVALIVAYAVGKGMAATVFVVVSVTLAVYIAWFLSVSSPRSTVRPLDREQQCRVCGTPFRRIRANQIYCGPPCRNQAAAWRRKNRLDEATRVDDRSHVASQPLRSVTRHLTRQSVRRRPSKREEPRPI
jgi:hypothetical protein